MKGRQTPLPGETGGAKCLNQLFIKHTSTRLVFVWKPKLDGMRQNTAYVRVSVCVFWTCVSACMSSQRESAESLCLRDSALLTCSRFSRTVVQAVRQRLPVGKSLNELVEAIGHRQRRRGGMQREVSKQPTRKELFTVQTLFPPSLLAPFNLSLVLIHWRARGPSQSSCFLLRFSLLLLSLLFSVALNILSSFVIACPVCIPLLLPPSVSALKVLPSAP